MFIGSVALHQEQNTSKFSFARLYMKTALLRSRLVEQDLQYRKCELGKEVSLWKRIYLRRPSGTRWSEASLQNRRRCLINWENPPEHIRESLL